MNACNYSFQHERLSLSSLSLSHARATILHLNAIFDVQLNLTNRSIHVK